jgi:Skp family chaperone for outer membrane proteins
MKRWMLAAVLGVASLFSTAAMAADPARIAVVNPVKIVAEMQERKDLQQKIDNNLKLYDGMLRERKEKASQLKAALDALKPGTPQYEEKKQQFIQADIELAVWAKSTQTSMEQDRKVQMRGLFDRVEAAVGEIAKQKGYDLVLANQADDLPEDLDRMNIDQLRGALRSRNILFASDKIDITPDVLAAVDAKYRSVAAPK